MMTAHNVAPERNALGDCIYLRINTLPQGRQEHRLSLNHGSTPGFYNALPAVLLFVFVENALLQVVESYWKSRIVTFISLLLSIGAKAVRLQLPSSRLAALLFPSRRDTLSLHLLLKSSDDDVLPRVIVCAVNTAPRKCPTIDPCIVLCYDHRLL